MDTRTIGSLTVSVVGLGCNNFGMRIGRKETGAVVEGSRGVGGLHTSIDVGERSGTRTRPSKGGPC